MEPATSLPDILAAAGIRLKRLESGRTEHIRCPKCEGGRTGEVSLAVTVDEDGRGATWICHRGSCGWQDGARVRSDRLPTRERPTKPPPQHAAAQVENRPDWLYAFFADRRIGARTVNEFGCYAVTRWFPNGLGDRPCIVFPYRFNGAVVNRKYRPHPEKQPQQQERDALPTLFNVDHLGAEPDEVVWCEGEPDVMALFECGIPNAVTLKDGAPSQVNAANEKRFEALRTHEKVLEKAKRIVLAGDNDPPGLALREELARRLGRHRCWVVDWPDGCKDACDTLRAKGPDVVVKAVRGAQPYPIDGLQRVTGNRLLDLRRMPPPRTMSTGTDVSDAILRLPTEGRLIIVSGIPNHGKTTWTRFVMVHTAQHHDRRWTVFSPEMQPWEHFVAQCAEVLSGKPFWPVPGVPSMSDEEIFDIGEWLGKRLTMLVCDAEDQAPTLDWLLERARAAVLRDGTTDLLLDPWNEVDQSRPVGMTETDFIGRGLQRLKAFALRHGCNVWIIAHPAKPVLLKSGEKRAAPGPYDIASSAHWANKPDVGLTVHSPNSGQTELHVWKARMSRWGKRGTVATMNYNPLCGRYSAPDFPRESDMP